MTLLAVLLASTPVAPAAADPGEPGRPAPGSSPACSLSTSVPETGFRPPAPLADYAGLYRHPLFGTAAIDTDGPAPLLLTIGPRHRQIPLIHHSGECFRLLAPGDGIPADAVTGTLAFQPDRDGAIAAFVLALTPDRPGGPFRSRFTRMTD